MNLPKNFTFTCRLRHSQSSPKSSLRFIKCQNCQHLNNNWGKLSQRREGVQRAIIFKRAGGRCQWVDANNRECGHKFNWSDDWDADHIINHADGGLTTVENGQVLCAYRNRANGNGQVICPLMSTD